MDEEKIDKIKRLQDEIVKKIQSDRADNIAATMGNIHQSLVVDTLNNPNKLPEEVFVSQFLPYFRGDKNAIVQPEAMALWISIAGSPFSEVSIINSVSGEEIYRVPPVMSSEGISPTDRSSRPLDDLMFEANLHAQITPIRGMNYIAGITAEQASKMKPNDNTGVLTHRWTEVFDRYDKNKPKEEKGNETKQSNLNGSLLSYDD